LARIEALDVAVIRRKSGLRRLVGPTIAAVIGVAILLSLGFWQLRRLTWKEALLARVASRLHAPPQPLPAVSTWAALTPDDYEYRHVVLRGTFENDEEVPVYDPGGAAGGRPDRGPGYLILTPLRLDDGSHVIVNRGFVAADNKDPATRPDGQITGETTLVGVMQPPQSRNFFIPADNPAKGAWFTRDPVEIAAFERLDRAAPFTVDADPTVAAPLDGPAGGATAIDIPNNHLSYAITWFGIAGGLIGVYGAFAWRRLRESS
jgi:surfeit locus 1 family protein